MKGKGFLSAARTLVSSMVEEKRLLILAFLAMLVSAVLSLLGPVMIGYTVDHYILPGDYHGVLVFSSILLVMYLISLGTGYVQTKLMGTVGQRMLYTLRNSLFNKLQELPVDFFNQNKAGDLISRINNDTEKINQFFSQSLMQFLRSILIMLGAAVFLLTLNPELGLATLAPALGILIFTQLISPWVKRKNSLAMKTMGSLSSEVQESLNNFNVIVAFNRRDYFRDRFRLVNEENYKASLKSGLANNLLMPVYSFFSNIGQLIVLIFGIYLIAKGHFSLGLLISFLAYSSNFYNPLRQMAALYANFQVALAGWDRIRVILNMQNNMLVLNAEEKLEKTETILHFKDVSFRYPGGKEVLSGINFSLEKGKTYAFVGPTGGGKTTTASLIARLYDPVKGTIYLDGEDIRSYPHDERARRIGFILQDPFLFSGTVRENILYGNEQYQHYSAEDLRAVIRDAGLESLLERFSEGLEAKVQVNGDGISLGQKQLIAFMRAVLRKPDILILDEATANIDTVTEQLLEQVLEKLPEKTTKVIIAHRLNTIENAEKIYFVNSGEVTLAGSLRQAVEMLLHGKRDS
ncbi:MAG: ABC transporter ATP-binding protein [Bacteroidales bacterium]|nr:ABC transporter ATP-binding protein [Bacteroidales bacterium]